MKFGKDILTVAVLTLITVLTWIGVEAYHTLTRENIPKVLKEQIAPLDDQLPREVFGQLGGRLTFSEDELNTRTPLPVIETVEEPPSNAAVSEFPSQNDNVPKEE